MSLEVQVFLEVKRLIQAAQLIVDITSCQCHGGRGVISPRSGGNGSSAKKGDVELQCEVRDRSVVLSRACGCRREIQLHCDVMPDGCSGMQWVKEDGLHLRLPVTNLPHTNDQYIGCTDESEMVFICGACRSSISRSDGCSVTRVLPLPSGNWSAAAEQWYCPCKPNRPAMHDGKFVPQREGDCLEGISHWILRARCIDQGAISCSKESPSSCSILCRQCQHFLGHASHTSEEMSAELDDDACITLLRSHVLSVHASLITIGKTPRCPCLLEGSLYRQLSEASQESGCCKFVLCTYDPALQPEGSSEDSPADSVACLWLMSASVDVSVEGSWSSGDACSAVLGTSASSCTMHSGKHLQRALKVLYKHGAVSRCDMDSWLLDASAQSLYLSKTLAEHLLTHLSDSTKVLPPSMRSINGFQIGYLFSSPWTLATADSVT